MIVNILFGVFFFTVLSLTGFLIFYKWNEFKELRVGDSCGKFTDCNSTNEVIISDIIKVDTDEVGYTTKIYTNDSTYTFWEFVRDNIMVIYD